MENGATLSYKFCAKISPKVVLSGTTLLCKFIVSPFIEYLNKPRVVINFGNHFSRLVVECEIEHEDIRRKCTVRRCLPSIIDHNAREHGTFAARPSGALRSPQRMCAGRYDIG